MIDTFLGSLGGLQVVLQGFGQTLNSSGGTEVNNPLPRVILTICILIIIQIVLHYSIDRIVERAVRHHKHTSHTEERKREATLKNFFHPASMVVVWLIGFIIILWEFDVKIGPLLTGAGILSVVAGLGAQSLIKDALAGVFIILENQIRVDDIVTVVTSNTSVSGLVEEINIRTIRLRDIDGNLHIVTNGSIGVITNQSFQFAQVNIDIHLTYDTDIDQVERLINEAGLATAASKEWKENTLEPIKFLRVDALSESNVTVKALGKVKPGTQWQVAGDFRRRLKKLFDQHKIPAPYQNIVVHKAETKPKQ